MRLDEWQKFIEAQFLDDETAPAPEQPSAPTPPVAAAEAAPDTASEPPSVVRKTEGLTTVTVPTSDMDTMAIVEASRQPSSGHPGVPAFLADAATERIPLPETPASPPAIRFEVIPRPVEPVAKRARKSNRQQSLQIYPVFLDPSASPQTPKSDTGAGTAPTSVRAKPSGGEPARPISANRLGPPPELDAQFPAFDGYLPASHRASPGVAAPHDEPYDEAVVQVACTLASTSLDEVEPDRDLDVEPNSGPTRRTARTRAPHARNVRPEHVASGLTAAELWEQVPRHVQTLLALDRLETETETAQSSYKRPFQETRHELIERLLDPVLSLEETARLLNVCPTTVRRYTNRGILTHYRKEPEHSTVGDTASIDRETRQRRFRLSDILAFLEAQQTAIEADRQKDAVLIRSDASGAAPSNQPTTDERDLLRCVIDPAVPDD